MTIEPQELEDHKRRLFIWGFPYDDKSALEDLMRVRRFTAAISSGEIDTYTMTASDSGTTKS